MDYYVYYIGRIKYLLHFGIKTIRPILEMIHAGPYLIMPKFIIKMLNNVIWLKTFLKHEINTILPLQNHSCCNTNTIIKVIEFVCQVDIKVSLPIETNDEDLYDETSLVAMNCNCFG